MPPSPLCWTAWPRGHVASRRPGSAVLDLARVRAEATAEVLAVHQAIAKAAEAAVEVSNAGPPHGQAGSAIGRRCGLRSKNPGRRRRPGRSGPPRLRRRWTPRARRRRSGQWHQGRGTIAPRRCPPIRGFGWSHHSPWSGHALVNGSARQIDANQWIWIKLRSAYHDKLGTALQIWRDFSTPSSPSEPLAPEADPAPQRSSGISVGVAAHELPVGLGTGAQDGPKSLP